MHRLQLALSVTIGLLVGLGVTYVALRDDAGASAFDGPPSVAAIERPAGSAASGVDDSGEAILARAAAAESTPPATPAVEPRTAQAALARFLEAETADRADESFALLAPDAQRRYGSVAAWRQSRAERVVAATFTITGERATADGTEVTVQARRTPSITPFRGLVPAESTEQWLVQRPAGSVWRVARPTPLRSEPLLPNDAGAVTTAQRWVDGAARCDAAITDLQLERALLGAADRADLACRTKGAWRAVDGEVVPAAELADATSFVAAYGPSVGRWARAVPVSNGTERFLVVLGPVGQDWRVMGLASG